MSLFTWDIVEETKVKLDIDVPLRQLAVRFDRSTAAELRDDMAEAVMELRGMDQRELMASEVDPGDWFYMMGDAYKVVNVLADRTHTILQTEHDDEEIRVFSDKQITVYRPRP